ncbi:MAG: hypothetical protein K2N92_01725 [Malacoplasma sp.]|nr:hypothetical protein [Malacoplasma sp.]MDE5841783.1 hypothetical protein [Malacoplasma sp.]MDE6563133.1 hypothetical protein [Malacoplasma sp.]MDE7112298.1 hypothetical protein [Malacoplasma sp.]
MNKKKILQSVLVGTSAVAIGVGIGVPTGVASEKQSSNVDINDNQNTDNPNIDDGSSSQEQKFASAPQQAVYEGSINWGEAKDKDSLNAYLYSKFHEGTSQSYDMVKDLLENDNEFANVEVEYVNNSADYEKSSFEIKVTPIQDYSWNDNTNASKNILVEIPKLDKTEWILNVPQNLSYSQTIEGKDVKNSEQLNSYLTTNFNVSNLNLENDNLDIKLVENSASFENKNFKVAVTPKSGFAWTDGKTGTIQVVVNVDIKAEVVLQKDASFATGDTYNLSLDVNYVTNNNSFDNYLKTNFKTIDLEKYSSYKNVDVKYVDGSANYDNSQFKLSITPLAGHAFNDGTVEPKIQVVTGGLDKNFANFDTKSINRTSGVFKNIPYIILDDNKNDSVTYSISSWTYEWEFLRNLEGWNTYWSVSTDNGETWERAGSGKSVTVNKTMLPESGLLIRYEVEVKETDISAYGISSSYVAYISNPVKVLN